MARLHAERMLLLSLRFPLRVQIIVDYLWQTGTVSKDTIRTHGMLR